TRYPYRRISAPGRTMDCLRPAFCGGIPCRALGAREDIVLAADDADDRPTVCRDAGVQDIGCRILVQITHVPRVDDQQGVPCPVVLAQRAYADHWHWHGPPQNAIKAPQKLS